MSGVQLGKKYYRTRNGKEPAREYINSLDKATRARVFVQIDRAKAGNPGKGHGVGKVDELVIDYGPGYRVYYVELESEKILLLLVAGDKSTQQNDIKKAEEYLKDYHAQMEELK